MQVSREACSQSSALFLSKVRLVNDKQSYSNDNACLQAIIFAALFSALSCIGVNIQPLLASVGASSLIIGLAAQNLLSNVVAAINLVRRHLQNLPANKRSMGLNVTHFTHSSFIMQYTTRPFIAGDHVKLLLLSNGNLFAEGVVVAVYPLRTIIRDDEGIPVYINNSSIITGEPCL